MTTGYETALALATANAQVIMACRDAANPEGKCQTAVATIKSLTGNEQVSALPCDLSSFASIRNFTTTLKQQVDKVNVLINNAGLLYNSPHLPVLTEDGYDMVFQVNMLGHHLLT